MNGGLLLFHKPPQIFFCNMILLKLNAVYFHKFSFRLFQSEVKVKVKQSRYRPWSGPEGSRKLKFPDFMTTAQDGGKVVSLTHRPPLPPGNTPGTHLC